MAAYSSRKLVSNELELCTFSIPWGEIHVLILVLLHQTLVHGISTRANSLGHRIASELARNISKQATNKQREWLSV